MRILLISALCLLTGCLSRPTLDKQTFIFGPIAGAAAPAAQNGRILGVRSLEVAAPFEGKSFVYRTGEYAYERDPYAGFMVPPSDELTSPILEWFHDAAGFSVVPEEGSELKPNTLVEIDVPELYGDFRSPQKPAAVLAMRFIFFDARNGHAGKLIFERQYSRRIPVEKRSATALMDGWNHALAEILEAATQDLNSAK